MLLQYYCAELVQNSHILLVQCALLHMLFGNDQVVRLLEHVR